MSQFKKQERCPEVYLDAWQRHQRKQSTMSDLATELHTSTSTLRRVWRDMGLAHNTTHRSGSRKPDLQAVHQKFFNLGYTGGATMEGDYRDQITDG